MNHLLEPLLSPHGLVSLLTLTVLEVVLGIDNVIFISILAGRLKKEDQPKARFIGLSLALVMRIILLVFIAWIVSFAHPFGTLFGVAISLRDVILMAGGVFLMYKSTMEIHEKLEGEEISSTSKTPPSLISAIFQIVVLDMVFSFDSILTAMGVVKDPTSDILIMIIAVIISIIIMLLFSGGISDFINRHPTVRMLALSFLLMIGVLLVVQGFHVEVPKGYIYFAMTFSLFVEILNLKAGKKSKPVHLKNTFSESEINDKKNE